MISRIFVATLALALLGAASVDNVNAATEGVVFTMSNGSNANKVLTWRRSGNGALSYVGETQTGGRGTGGPLNNQAALALTPDGGWLYVVNPGSNTVSVFRVNGTSLTRTDVEPTQGKRPVSVAVNGSLVYVLNGGGKGNIRGFRRDSSGNLTFVNGSARPLSTSRPKPAQIGFNPQGTRLVVTELRTDRITRYRVLANGAIEPPQWSPSAGAEPFGFEFSSDGILVVSEAGNHVPDGSSASSYALGPGAPTVITAALPTTETAACWTAVTPDGNFAYVTNTPDHSISGFAIGGNGSLAMLDADGRTAVTGAGSFPIDLDTSRDGEFLYVLAAGTHRILAYAISGNGSLSARPGVGGLPGAANGLVAR